MACACPPLVPVTPGFVDVSAGFASPPCTEVPLQPAKLFIGGISRRTTTKQLRDHFSTFGQVLDCVAMRQPDGRPRGFGYVTLASTAAAERALREPQMIDDRIVDLKIAVPDPADNAKGNIRQASPAMGTTHVWGSSLSPVMQMPSATMPFVADGVWSWTNGQHSPCMDIGQMTSIPVPPVVLPLTPQTTPPGLELNSVEPCYEITSPSVPLLEKKHVGLSHRTMRAKVPLGEVTNIMNNESAEAKRGKLGSMPAKVKSGENVKPLFVQSSSFTKSLSPPSLLDIYVDPADEASGNVNASDQTETEVFVTNAPLSCPSSLVVSADPSPVHDSGSQGPEDDQIQVGTERYDHDCDVPLPSVGSALHFTNECRRCNFFAKGRCQNGLDCTFCHFPHDRRKLSRQEKRDLKAAVLAIGTTPTSQPSSTSAASVSDGIVARSQEHVSSGELPALANLPTPDGASATEPVPRASQLSLPPGLAPPGLAPPALHASAGLERQSFGQLCANMVLPQWGAGVGAPLLATGPPSTSNVSVPLQQLAGVVTSQKEVRTSATQTEEKYVICGRCGRLARVGEVRCHV